MIQSKLVEFHPYKVNDCEIIMKQQGLEYALCTMKDGKIVLRDSYLNCSVMFDNVVSCNISKFNTIFHPAEYLGLQVKMNESKIPFDSYYTCAYSNFPLYDTKFPEKYGDSKEGINYPSFVCSPLYYKKDYHHWALSGFVLNKKGKYTIIRIYVFDGSLPPTYDFKKNLNEGLKVFELEGEIV